MRAVVIGGSGQIGGWLLRGLADSGHAAIGTYATVPFPGLVPLDAADLVAAAAWLRSQRPDVVFYPAGFTWVDGCERDPARAHTANVEQPLNLARVAADLGARFVYFSTDYVFDGRSGPYTEDDPPDPLSVYGRAKYEAERVLGEALGPRLLTVRTTWVYGPERQGKNFAYQLAKTLGEGRPLVCPSDQVSNPSYGPDVARTVLALAEAGWSGLVHVAGPDWIDRVQFARALARALGCDPALIVAKTTAELGQPAARPLKGGLRTPRLDGWLPGSLRPLDRCLADFQACLAAPDGWVRPLRPA
jgi:dTDP-4-dehydrorhamnose reductase